MMKKIKGEYWPEFLKNCLRVTVRDISGNFSTKKEIIRINQGIIRKDNKPAVAKNKTGIKKQQGIQHMLASGCSTPLQINNLFA